MEAQVWVGAPGNGGAQTRGVSVISGRGGRLFPQGEGPGVLDEGLEGCGETQGGSGGRGGRLEPVCRLPFLLLRCRHHGDGADQGAQRSETLQGWVPGWWPGARTESLAGWVSCAHRTPGRQGPCKGSRNRTRLFRRPGHSPCWPCKFSLSKQSRQQLPLHLSCGPWGRPALTRAHPGFSVSRFEGHPALWDGSGNEAE